MNKRIISYFLLIFLELLSAHYRFSLLKYYHEIFETNFPELIVSYFLEFAHCYLLQRLVTNLDHYVPYLAC